MSSTGRLESISVVLSTTTWTVSLYPGCMIPSSSPRTTSRSAQGQRPPASDGHDPKALKSTPMTRSGLRVLVTPASRPTFEHLLIAQASTKASGRSAAIRTSYPMACSLTGCPSSRAVGCSTFPSPPQ